MTSPEQAVLKELLRWTSVRSPAAAKKLGPTPPIKVVSYIRTHSSTASSSTLKLIFFHMHPLQLWRRICFISRMLCGLKLMPKFIAVRLQQSNLFFRPVEKCASAAACRLQGEELLPVEYSISVFRHQSFLSTEEFAQGALQERKRTLTCQLCGFQVARLSCQ